MKKLEELLNELLLKACVFCKDDDKDIELVKTAKSLIFKEFKEGIEKLKKKSHRTTESRYGQTITIPISGEDKIYNQALSDCKKMIGDFCGQVRGE